MVHLIAASWLTAAAAQAAVKTEPVEYKDGAAVLQGTIAYDPAAKGRRPGVIVVHEWTGHGPYAVSRAQQLAKLGYVAFAIDMYGKGVRAASHEDAAKLSKPYLDDRTLMRQRAKAALDLLRADKRVDGSRIAAIGYCFGGTTALELARAGYDLKGVASFHGMLGTPSPASKGAVKAKVLVAHGAIDGWTSKDLPAFQDEMNKAGADWELDVYSGAVHSFTVPDAGNDVASGRAYNAEADARSWERLTDFLAETLR